MSLWADFKKFAFKGNVVDLAVGVVIGAAFGKIVSSLVANIIMPLASLALPSGNWRNAGVMLRRAEDPKNDVVLRYGDFLGTVLDFFIVAFAIFVLVSRLVKALERRRHEELPKPADVRPCPFCFESIPQRATRCRACTSELPAAGPPAAQPAS